MNSAGGPPFAPELADVGPVPELVAGCHELPLRSPYAAPDKSPPFAAELVTDRPPHLEELA